MGMEIFDIRESGSNALLKYALQHKVNPLKNQNFKNIIISRFTEVNIYFCSNF